VWTTFSMRETGWSMAQGRDEVKPRPRGA
jgi:hypothetical protein